jgi:hypothetical protein
MEADEAPTLSAEQHGDIAAVVEEFIGDRVDAKEGSPADALAVIDMLYDNVLDHLQEVREELFRVMIESDVFEALNPRMRTMVMRGLSEQCTAYADDASSY